MLQVSPGWQVSRKSERIDLPIYLHNAPDRPGTRVSGFTVDLALNTVANIIIRARSPVRVRLVGEYECGNRIGIHNLDLLFWNRKWE